MLFINNVCTKVTYKTSITVTFTTSYDLNSVQIQGPDFPSTKVYAHIQYKVFLCFHQI
jgi:hypothetical protein